MHARNFTYLLLVFSTISSASELTDADADADADAMELGYRVSAINAALQNPAAAGAMQAITELGHDQRYYVMVRGWLMYQLQGDKSILDARQEQAPNTIKARVDFIQQAIRAIDLE
jgi:hypothetical protein